VFERARACRESSVQHGWSEVAIYRQSNLVVLFRTSCGRYSEHVALHTHTLAVLNVLLDVHGEVVHLTSYSFADVPMDSLALINWKEASFAVNGDEEADDAFLMELLATFYHETLPRLVKILTAAVTYRRTPDKFLEFPGDIEARNIEKVFKDEAHAIKGSSANIRLWRLAKVSNNYLFWKLNCYTAVQFRCRRLKRLSCRAKT
jgi:HPt (histidine-containing phosphotransfer) domain-containing protein